MKKLCFTTLLLFGLTAHAETVGDTLVIKNAEKVTIETLDTVQHISIRGARDNAGFRYDQRIAYKDTTAVRRSYSKLKDFNKIRLSKKGKKNYWESSLHLCLGLNAMTSVNDEVYSDANWSFKVWPSIEIGVAVTADWCPFGFKNKWSLGLGVDWRNYRMSKDTYIDKDNNARLYLEPYVDEQTERRTSLNVFSVQVPLLYTHTFDADERWSVTLGAIVNFNTTAYAFRKYTAFGEDFEVERHDIGVRPVTLDFMVAVDAPYLPMLYFKYSPTTLFKSGRGPKMHQLSFGIGF